MKVCVTDEAVPICSLNRPQDETEVASIQHLNYITGFMGNGPMPMPPLSVAKNR